MNLLALIPWGRENAITREQLHNLTGWSDRKVRKEIKALVEAGEPVISLSGSKGYWRSGDIDEIERFLRECDSRSRSEAMTTAPLRRIVARAKGENMVPVRAHLRRVKLDKPIEGQVRF